MVHRRCHWRRRWQRRRRVYDSCLGCLLLLKLLLLLLLLLWANFARTTARSLGLGGLQGHSCQFFLGARLETAKRGELWRLEGVTDRPHRRVGQATTTASKKYQHKQSYKTSDENRARGWELVASEWWVDRRTYPRRTPALALGALDFSAGTSIGRDRVFAWTAWTTFAWGRCVGH